MGKRKLALGISFGALLGGAVSLLDKGTRTYTVNKLSEWKEESTYMLSNPSESAGKLKAKAAEFSRLVEDNTDKAVNVVEQVNASVSKLKK